MTTFSKKEKVKLANVLLRMPLGGVLDIQMSHRRYDVLEAVIGFIDTELFKKYGYRVKISSDYNRIRKEEYFEGNEEFCKKHGLTWEDGTPSYQKYLKFMKS